MKNLRLHILTSMLLMGGVSIAQTYKADVPSKTQSQDQWCWATDSQCILEYYGTKKEQCQIVEYARTLKPSTFGNTACCTNPSGKCNQPNEIKYNYGITGMLDYFGKIKSVVSDGPITVAKITSELEGKRPFVIGIFWSQGGGHVVVGCGYDKTAGSLTFMDSWRNNSFSTTKYTSGKSITTRSGSGTWAETLVITTPFTTTGIADAGELAKEVSIYPNPSGGLLNISSEYTLKTINVFNAAGQLVNSFAVNGNKTFSLNIAEAGFYNVQVVTDNGFAYKKVVVSTN